MGLEGDDIAIRERIETLAQAIRNKNVDDVMTHYAPDVFVFDVMPPLETQGADFYRKNFERWFASIEGPIDYQMSELKISTSDSHAFCFFLGHVKGEKPGGEKVDYSVRVTSCFQKANGQWLIGHEHVSMPASM